MTLSKFFRAFVEGQTISDGRTITAKMIDEIVETFNAETYSPRINVEHIAGFSPEPPFNGYGTVAAVKSQDDKISVAGVEQTRRALYMQVDGNTQLVALAKADQKPFPSVELTDSYAGSGKTGVVGLAFTDNPASIATQRLQFSRTSPGSYHVPGAEQAAIEFEAPTKDEAAFSALRAMFASLLPGAKAEPAPVVVTPPVVTPPVVTPPVVTPAAGGGADAAAAFAVQMTAGFAALMPVIEGMNTQIATLATLPAKFAALEQQLATTDASSQRRPPASGGGSDELRTDC